MSNVYFTSDLHLGHKNLIRDLRGMKTEDHDELIIKNWNEIVTKHDTVYILGDITMEKPDLILRYIPLLNGNIKVVGGNHDTFGCSKALASLGIPVMGCCKYKGFICTHIPVSETEVSNWRGNIHGHIHVDGEMEDFSYHPIHPKGRYYNVNVEFNDYKPVSFFDIVDKFQNIK